MATTRGWALHGNVVNALNYILDLQNGQKKTEEGILVDWKGEHTVSPYSAGYAWQLQKMMSGSSAKSETVGFHFQQSFETGSVTAEEALEISREWIEKITDGKCEYVMAVHTNTDNIHTHIIVNPIQSDGRLWNIFWKKDKLRFREASDQICSEHGLNILEKTAVNSRTYYEWMKDKATDEPEMVKRILNYLIPRVSSYEELKKTLDKLGFACKDSDSFEQPELDDKNLFCFTVNEVLLEESILNNPSDLPDEICVRIPYTKDHFIWVPKECFCWIQPSVNARIVLPKDLVLNSEGFEMEKVTVPQIREFFNLEKKNRSGLRVKIPGGKRFLKTKYLADDLDIETVKSRIRNGQTDPLIDALLSSKKFSSIQDLRRTVLSDAGITLSYQSCSSYVSQRQEAYYQGLARKCEARRNQLAYHKLLMDDRKNLPTLQNRKQELLSEIDDLNGAISECEQHVMELEKDILSETGNITQEQIEEYISSNILPLREQREECRDLIAMYTESIHRVQKEERQDEREKS